MSLARDSNHGAAAPAAALEMVVAVAENDVIGRRNGLPWRLPADLRRFRTLTLGKHVLMGRRTYESIGKALPGRTNLVLSRAAHFAPADCIIVGTLDAARAAVRDAARAAASASAGANAALMVIGGAQIYRECLPFTNRIHLTLVHARIDDGDTFFDAWRGAEWREVSRERHAAAANDSFDFSFITLERSPVF